MTGDINGSEPHQVSLVLAISFPVKLRCGVHRSPFTVHRSPFTVRRSPFTVHRSPFTVRRSPFTVHRSPFTVHRSPSPFTVHRSPFAVRLSPVCVPLSPVAVPRSRVAGRSQGARGSGVPLNVFESRQTERFAYHARRLRFGARRPTS